uniref:Disease resistance protein RGA4 n=1 Tax=Cajanus cajan TaxID=3821 RepID=A0A151THB1_CAJCA|nr:Putative disease resistance protein RGA4 [Cajanus cajan]
MEEIIDQLMLWSRSEDNGESPVPVIAISGLAGIGKTKLVDDVCQDQKVQEQVGSQVRVPGTNYNTFDADSIAKQIINSAPSPSPTTKTLNILVILDDWRAEIKDNDVKMLHDKVKEHGKASQVLKKVDPRVTAIVITTRSCLVVREIAASPIMQYDLQGLNEKQSVFLLKKALGRGACDDNASITKIVGQCRGVPLAIIAMAKWLQSPRSEYLMPVEQLICSYYDKVYEEGFPYKCFPYFSLFPQDFLFDAERLIHLWMAEGFLGSPEPETGRGYLRDFVGRSMFQDVKVDEFGEVRSFKLHPLMHDIARFVADREIITMDPIGHKVHGKVKRASFDLSLNFSRGIPRPLYDKAKSSLASLLFFANPESRFPMQLDMSTSMLENIFKSFKKLRVLDLRDLEIGTVPSSIGDLKDLEYLDLSQNNIMEKLPNNITKLFKLQTLKLFCCYSLKELPKDFENLKQLKHLDIEGCLSLTHMPPKMGKLTSLQTLSAFVANKDDPKGGLEELLNLNKLRGHLEILYLDRVQQFGNSKSGCRQKIGVQSLTLRWDLKIDQGKIQHHLLPEDFLMSHFELRVLILMGYRVPDLSLFKSTSTQFEHLVKLSLQDCQCEYISQEDALPQQLKTLELIRLDNLEYVARNCDKDAAFYKTLVELTVWGCPKLKSWWPEVKEGTGARDSIPLENFHIQNCNHLKNLCDAFQHLSSLQRLTIENCADIHLCGPNNQWNGLKSLRFLTIREIPILSSLSFGDSVTTLRELTVHNCEGLTSISDSIGKLTSLRRLEISKCNKLKSLPKEMENLKSLKTLLILNCKLLLSRCQQETGRRRLATN